MNQSINEQLELIAARLESFHKHLSICVDKMDVIERLTLKDELKQLLAEAEAVDNLVLEVRNLIHNQEVGNG